MEINFNVMLLPILYQLKSVFKCFEMFIADLQET